MREREIKRERWRGSERQGKSEREWGVRDRKQGEEQRRRPQKEIKKLECQFVRGTKHCSRPPFIIASQQGKVLF